MSNELTIVYVPWYTKSALDANKIDLTTLSNDIGKINGGDTKLNNMARSDINDFVAINRFMGNHLFVSGDITDFDSDIRQVSRYDVDAKALETVDLLSSNSNDSVKDTIILTYENNTIYVILKEGFSNFIKFNNKELERDLLNELIDFAFKYFKSIDIYDSRYFKKFLILNKTK